MPSKKTRKQSMVWIATAESVQMRGGELRELDVNQIGGNVNLFLGQMGTILKDTPDKLGPFQFVEFEVHADISAEGQIILLGTGGKVGASGGIKFVFRRQPITK